MSWKKSVAEKKMAMEFYQEAEVDFDDKLCDVAELLNLREGDSKDEKKSDSLQRKKEVPTEVVLPHEIDSDSDEDVRLKFKGDQLHQDIALDILQVTGDTLRNEPLEAQYWQNCRKDPLAENKLKSAAKKTSRSSNSKIGSSKILKESQLRKGGPEKMDPEKRDRIMKWVSSIPEAQASIPEAQASVSEAQASVSKKKNYKATSQRHKMRGTPTTTSGSNEP